MTWHEQAACLDRDATLWETPNNDKTTKSNEYAIAICKACPVRVACLDEAMQIEQGLAWAGRWHIYGGLMPGERARLDNGTPRGRRKESAA